MRKTVFFAAVCFALSASAQTLRVDSFALDSLHLVGSYCEFSAQRDTLLASDWIKTFWMKIDGKMVEFQSGKSDAEVEKQLKNKRWRETLKTDDITLLLNLVETGRGDDSVAFRGYIDVQRGGIKKHLLVVGGCGA